jgi:hypothetical protein
VRDELVEVAGIVHLGEIVMDQEARIAGADPLELSLHERRVRIFIGPALRDQLRKRPRFADALAGLGERLGVEAEHLPRHAAHIAAGVDVVAHERDAVGGEVARDQSEELLAHRRRDPRVEPMRDDVVECTGIRGELREVALRQGEVGEAGASREALPRLDRLRGDVESDEFALRQRVRHRHEVGSIAAGDLEHPAALDRRRLHTEESGHRRQPLGMRVGVGLAGVANLVIGGHGGKVTLRLVPDRPTMASGTRPRTLYKGTK